MDYGTGIRLDVMAEGLKEITNQLDVLLLLFKEADPVKYKKVIDEINTVTEKDEPQKKK